MSSFSLDEKWYDQFVALASEQDYEYLVGNDLFRQRQKREFLAEVIRNPRMDYPLINLTKINARWKKLSKLREAIEDQEENKTIRQAYIDKIDEKITELQMITAGKKLEKCRDQKEQKKQVKIFKQCTENLYGKPTPAVFNVALDNLREKIVRNIMHQDKIIAQASDELLQALPMADEEYTRKYTFWQNKRNLSRIRRDLLDEIGQLSELDTEKETYLPEDIQNFLMDKLRRLNLNDWRVEIDNNYQSVAVDQKKKIIHIPKTRQTDTLYLKKLALHEIGVHVYRRENGERSKLKLLGIGLDRYEIGEEGLAGLVENFFDDRLKFSFYQLLSYVSIGLVYGLDGQPRDWRDMYDILLKLYLYIGLVRWPEKEIEEIKLKAINLAYNRCIRIFRGTNGQTRGVCFTRDLIYLKGKISIWDVINHRPEELRRVYCGKYNPANEKHVGWLNDLGIN